MAYTEESTKALIDEYLRNKNEEDIIERLAEKMGRSPRSIIGKLVREKVYEKRGYRSKTGDVPCTKKEIVANVCKLVGATPEKVESFEKVGKTELLYFYRLLAKKLGDSSGL